MEVACNILDPKITPPSLVLSVAEKKASSLGISIDSAYKIGFTGEEIHAQLLSALPHLAEEEGGARR